MKFERFWDFLKRFCTYPLKLVKQAVFSVVFLSIFFLCTIGNEICRLFVKIIVFPTKYRLIGHGSANFFNISKERRPGKFVLTLFTSPDPVDITKERALWETRILSNEAYSAFKMTICRKFGYGVWRDDRDTFDITNHVKVYDGPVTPEGNDGVFTEDEIKHKILPELYKDNSTDTSKPHWEWFIIPNYFDEYGKKKSARIFRYHHTYMDGVHAGLLLGEKIFDWNYNTNQKNPRPPFILDPRGDVSKKYTASFIVKVGVWFLIPIFLVKMLTGENKKEYQTLLPTASEKTHFITKKFPLAPLKKLATITKLPITSICATATRPALENLFSSKGKLGGLTSLIAPLAVPPFTRAMKNRVAVTIVDVPLDGKAVINVAYSSPLEMLFSYMFGEWLGRLPTKCLEMIPLDDRLNMALSNLPFTFTEGSINDGRIDGIYPFVLLNYPRGVAVGLASYGASMHLTLVTDEANLSGKESEEFMEVFVEELNKLCESESVGDYGKSSTLEVV